MSNDLKNYAIDLIKIIQENYNDSLVEKGNEIEKDKYFRLGCNFAYFNILDILESQLRIFGEDVTELGQIVPALGQRV